ncbi:MAG TPA: putative Ig domain-containing protein, partial [Patescibacteria group bacterium]|nr:putative Ig domain-containing protein [Patescibacteria group bacterium]
TLPKGMNYDESTGQLSGTPAERGVYTFRVRVTSTNQPTLEHAYTFAITAPDEVLPAHSTVDTVAYPLDAGDITGLGLYTNGDNCAVMATPRAGYRFSNWTDNNTIVSTNATYQFPVSLNRSLVANFVPGPPQIRITSQSADAHTIEWTTNMVAVVLEQTTNLVNWTSVNAPVSVVGSNASVTLPTIPGARFYRFRMQ